MGKQDNKPCGDGASRLFVQRIFAGERKSHDAVRSLLKAHGAVA